MMNVSRLVATVGVAGIFGGCLTRAVSAQLSGVQSGLVNFAPIDGAALGDTRLASVGVFLGESATMIGGGGGVGGGALRAYTGLPTINGSGFRMALGAGYARTFASRELAGPFRGTIGGELRAAFRRNTSTMGAAGLALPIGLTAGNPAGWSFGLYAAPYAESATLPRYVYPTGCSFNCSYVRSGRSVTNAVGVGTGLRLSLGHVSVSAMVHDVLGRDFQTGLGELTTAFTYRLGHDE
jgi:hypothetical protein